MEITYDSQGRVMFHPALHPNTGKPWTEDELEYLCKFHMVDGLELMSYALGRTHMAINQKLVQLRKEGKYEYYRSISKFYV